MEGLTAHGWKLTATRRLDGQPFTFAVYENVEGHGKACPSGVIPLLAVPLPDDPQTPPPGFHMSPPLGLGVVGNTGVSPLSTPQEAWVYWSRPLPNWPSQPDAARIASHLHSALRDA